MPFCSYVIIYVYVGLSCSWEWLLGGDLHVRQSLSLVWLYVAKAKLYDVLEVLPRDEIEEALLNVLLDDAEPSVRYEARIVLEQIDNPPLEQRLKRLIDQGLLAWSFALNNSTL